VTAGPGRTRGEGGPRGFRHRDHTRGSLLGSLAALSLPMLATSGVMVVYQVADLSFLARLGEAPMAAAIIVNQTLRQLVIMLVMGIAFGSQALVARAAGEGRAGAAEQVAGQAVLLGAGLAALVAAAGLGFAGPLFGLAAPEPSFAPYGVPYLRLLFAFTFGMAGTQIFASVLGGAGDTVTPFLVLALATAVSIGAEWALMFGRLGLPALGVTGAALGIGAGQVVGLVLGAVVLFSGRSRIHLRWHHLRPDPVVLRGLLALSWPPAVQLGSQVVTTLAFVRLAGGFGESVVAAYAVGLRIGMIVPMVCFPLAGACATLVGQALGAGDTRRAWRAIGVSLLVHGCLMWSFALALLAFRSDVMDWLSDDPRVIEVGSEYLVYLAGAIALWAFYLVFLRALQGAGDMRVPMLISITAGVLVSIPLAFALSRPEAFGREGLWMAFLASSALATLGTGLRVASGRWASRGAASASPAVVPE
jgi:putative MATE family efflux protein